jgi:hypothetical protein
MKTQLTLIQRAAPLVLLLSTLNLQLSTWAQGTAFTYQGRLNDGANPAAGIYDLRFTIYDSLSAGTQQGGPLTNAATSVSNGLFTVTLDFGNQFPGANRWLEIGVRTNGNGAFSTLSPRQKITPTPYAIFAGTVSTNGLAAGTYANAVNLNNPANNFSGNGAGLTGVNAATLGGLGAGNFWQVGGNAGTGGASLGTLDGQPLKLASGNARVMLLETKVVNLGFFNNITAVNILGGANINAANSGVIGATISGGGSVVVDGFLTTPHPNTAVDNFGTIGGGLDNTAGYVAPLDTTNPDDGRAATVSGGENNAALGHHSFVGGGSNNRGESASSVIAGGAGNNIYDNGPFASVTSAFANSSCIGGGAGNSIGANASFFVNLDALNSVISGGSGNQIFGASYAAIPGGQGNAVTGSYGLAAGRRAKVNHTGAFVWGDSTDADFSSTAANQFAIRATGGVMLSDSTPNISFGTTTRQMLNLWGTQYGIGIQSATLYFRTDGAAPENGFIWYKGGVHNDAYANAGGGIELMHLVDGGLYVHGTYNNTSDRNEKENFTPVEPREVLEKVAGLPITRWNYKHDAATPHLGPVAQDFYAAFGVGPDDKHIATVDESGVALAAIQGLNQKLSEQEAALKNRDSEIQELRQAVAELQKTVRKITSQTQEQP